MTEPTYEVNKEALSKLTIADLTGLITLNKLYPTNTIAKIIIKVCVEELNKRINDIIIF